MYFYKWVTEPCKHGSGEVRCAACEPCICKPWWYGWYCNKCCNSGLLHYTKLHCHDDHRCFIDFSFRANLSDVWINYINVPENKRRRGIGTLLVKELQHCYRRQNCKLSGSIKEFTKADAERSVEFWKSIGALEDKRSLHARPHIQHRYNGDSYKNVWKARFTL